MTIPTLCELCCVALSVPGSEIPDSEETRYWKRHSIENPFIGLVIEQRRSPPDKEYLSYPPRHNPFQWRLVWRPHYYETEGQGDPLTGTRAVGIINGRWRGEGGVNTSKENIRILARQFNGGSLDQPDEAAWMNQADIRFPSGFGWSFETSDEMMVDRATAIAARL